MKSLTPHIEKHLPDFLPSGLWTICKSYLSVYDNISEIRLRKNKALSFSCGAQNIVSEYICTPPVFDGCVSLLLNSSAYKHTESILKGIIPLSHGFRAGISGSAIVDKGRITNIYDYTSINIRLPHESANYAVSLAEHLSTLPHHKRSTLVISPPSGGKTTFLREISMILSPPPVSERVCVVDTHFELSPLNPPTDSQLDILRGYPIDIGIEAATRYLNPQYIICDEIGNECYIPAIQSASHSGIPLIASAHASSYDELIRKPAICSLIENGIFCTLVTLSSTPPNFNASIRSL